MALPISSNKIYDPYTGIAKGASSLPISKTNVGMASTNPINNLTGQSSKDAQIKNLQSQIASVQGQIANATAAGYGVGGQFAGQNIPDSILKQSTTVISSDKGADPLKAQDTLNKFDQKSITTNPITGDATYADGTPYTPPTDKKEGGDTTTSSTISKKTASGKTVVYDPATGEAKYEDGGIYNPSFDPIVSEKSDEELKIEADYEQRKIDTDAITAAQITSIQNRYAELKKKQREINESSLAATRSALLMSGAAQHDVYSDQNIQLRMKQGEEDLRALENEENDLIASAKAAALSNNWKLLEQKNAEIKQIRDEKGKVTEQINTFLIDAYKKASDTKAQVDKDQAIGDIYTSGITDTVGILAELKKRGYDNITSKDITDTLKNIVPPGLDDLVKTLRENGAPPEVINKVLSSRTIQEAYESVPEIYLQKATGDLGEALAIKREMIEQGLVPPPIQDLLIQVANQKAKANIALSGLPNNVILQVDKLSKDFDSSPIVKQYNEVLNKKLSVDTIIQSGVKGPADLALVFEFMKALDPTSVVRETEYQTAAKSGNIFAGWAARFNGYLKEGGGFLPEQVRKDFQTLINRKYGVAEQQYKNLKSETARKINKKTGQTDGEDYLTNYEGAASLKNEILDTESEAQSKVDAAAKTDEEVAKIVYDSLSTPDPDLGRVMTYSEISQYLQAIGKIK